MQALIVGGSGLVGSALMRYLGSSAVGTYYTRPRSGLIALDAADEAAVRNVIRRSRADVVFFPAAEPNVEWCELNPELARERNLAPLRATLRAAATRRFIAFSSDYVFDGMSGPYAEDAVPRPISVYGAIKLELEEILLDAGGTVIRTTSVFGKEPTPGKNFVLRLIPQLRRGEQVRVPLDQISTPTYSDDLAAGAVRAAERGSRIWHVAGPDLVSRVELAAHVAKAFDLDARLIEPVLTSQLGQTARRPLRGGLRCDRYEREYGRPPGRPLQEALLDLRRALEATDFDAKSSFLARGGDSG